MSDEPLLKRRKRSRSIVKRAVAIGATATLVGFGVATPAVAAPGDFSEAESRFLSGSLLLDGVDLDSIAALAGVDATHDGTGGPVISTTDLDLAALGLVNVEIPGGVTVPLDDFLNLGLVNQYAEADNAGVSRAATGAVSDAGIIDTTGSGDYPADATLNLSSLLGAGVTDTVADLTVRLGAISAEASLDASAESDTIVRDYNIATGEIELELPPVTGLVDALVGDDGVASDVDDAVNSLVGSDGVLAQALATLNAVLSPIIGDPELLVAIDVDIYEVLNDVLDEEFGDGVVTVDLRTGAVTADLDALLMDEYGYGLNSLPPNTEVLSADVLNNLIDRVGTILETIPAYVTSVVEDALMLAELTVNADICILETLGVCVTGLEVDIPAQTLADVLDGSADATISLIVANLPVTVPIGTLLGTLAAPITTALFDATDGVVSTITPALTSVVTGIITELDPVVSVLNGVASLRANVQEETNEPEGTVYTETALRLTVGDLLGDGGIATVNLARASVGPNSDEGTAADADATDADATDADATDADATDADATDADATDADATDADATDADATDADATDADATDADATDADATDADATDADATDADATDADATDADATDADATDADGTYPLILDTHDPVTSWRSENNQDASEHLHRRVSPPRGRTLR
ncbi:MAG: choice-of-anchor G family protein, partial [Leucobacter sp.]